MKVKKYLIVLLILGSLTFWTGCSEEEESRNLPVRVRVQKAEILTEKESYAYSGTIEESETLPLSFSVTGTVVRVLVSEGDFVEKGQLLAVLDDATFKNAYEMSRASLEQAEDAYKRLKPMYENGNLPEIKFVEVETKLQQASAALAIDQKKLKDCSLYAPVDGFVGARSIEPGMNVTPGTTTIDIVQIEKVFAKISVSENEIADINRGQKAEITVGALGHKQFDGLVEKIGVVADPIAHTYKIKVAIPNKDRTIKPGMICEARIQTSESFSGVIIPNRAVQVDEEGKTFVFSVDENQGKAVRKFVETGRLLNEGIEVIHGLDAGELVVVSGQHKLVNNSLVQVIN